MAFENWEFYDRAVPMEADSTLTDFPLVIDGSRLSTTFWDNVKSDLGDVRASLDNNAEIPCYVHDYDHGAQTALIFVKATVGTTPPAIRIHYGNASATTPAVTATYGRNACFNSNIRAYWPDGGGYDVTGYANNLTMAGSPDVGGQAGPIGSSKSTEYDGSTQYGQATNNVPSDVPLAMLSMAYLDNDTANHMYLSVWDSAADSELHYAIFRGAVSGNPLRATSKTTLSQFQSATSTNSFSANAWVHASLCLTVPRAADAASTPPGMTPIRERRRRSASITSEWPAP